MSLSSYSFWRLTSTLMEINRIIWPELFFRENVLLFPVQFSVFLLVAKNIVPCLPGKDGIPHLGKIFFGVPARFKDSRVVSYQIIWRETCGFAKSFIDKFDSAVDICNDKANGTVVENSVQKCICFSFTHLCAHTVMLSIMRVLEIYQK